ncbi:MAG: hypothetical protein V7704_23435 [Aurantimonas endophytica]|uniref:hypothetical protein n=1 Tax=Aurantimonas endophytica TaxID=1522175 RepID=UPI003002A724
MDRSKDGARLASPDDPRGKNHRKRRVLAGVQLVDEMPVDINSFSTTGLVAARDFVADRTENVRCSDDMSLRALFCVDSAVRIRIAEI